MLVNSTQYIHPSLHCYLYRVPAPPAEDRPFRSNLCRHQRQATQRRAGLCRRIPLYLRQYRVGKLHQPHILLKLRPYESRPAIYPAQKRRSATSPYNNPSFPYGSTPGKPPPVAVPFSTPARSSSVRCSPPR